MFHSYYILSKVYLVIQIHSMVSSRIILLVLLLTVLSTQQKTEPKLIFIQEIFRHGARYPQKAVKIGDQFAEKEQLLGELTDEGRSMHYLLGRQLYQRYWKKLFGGTPYEHTYNQSRFFVKSTNVNRTIQSVQSQLYGLFEALPQLEITEQEAQYANPPYPGVKAQAGPAFGQSGRKYRPIAVHTQKSSSDPTKGGDFLYAFDRKFCPNQAHWMHGNSASNFSKMVYAHPPFKAAMKALSLALSDNQNLVNQGNYYQYYDNLVCLKYLGKPVPKIITQPSDTKRALDYIYTLSANIAFSLDQGQVHASATPFFRETLSNIHKTIDNQNSPDWVIYSAHDATLTVMLGALQLWSAECIFNNFNTKTDDPYNCITTFPIFATLMVFEVYKYDHYSQTNSQIFYSTSKSKQSDPLYTIKINYNGDYKQIPFCGYKQECEVKAFEEWVNSWAVKDFVKACGIDIVPEYQEELKLIQIGTILTVILCTIWYLLLSRRIKRTFGSKIRSFFESIGLLSAEKTKKK